MSAQGEAADCDLTWQRVVAGATCGQWLALHKSRRRCGMPTAPYVIWKACKEPLCPDPVVAVQCDLKYIDPSYMIRAAPTITTDRILCKVRMPLWPRTYNTSAGQPATAETKPRRQCMCCCSDNTT